VKYYKSNIFENKNVLKYGVRPSLNPERCKTIFSWI